MFLYVMVRCSSSLRISDVFISLEAYLSLPVYEFN
jgi:hypothetical protein